MDYESRISWNDGVLLLLYVFFICWYNLINKWQHISGFKQFSIKFVSLPWLKGDFGRWVIWRNLSDSAGMGNIWIQRQQVLWVVWQIIVRGLPVMRCVRFLWWISRRCSWFQWILLLTAASMGVPIRQRWSRLRSWRHFLVRWWRWFTVKLWVRNRECKCTLPLDMWRDYKISIKSDTY